VRYLVKGRELRKPIVQTAVFKYGGVPRALTNMCQAYLDKGRNWHAAVEACRDEWHKTVTAAREVLHSNSFDLMIAYAITGLAVDGDQLETKSLERCGACIYVDAAQQTITVPVAVLDMYVYNRDAHDENSGKKFDSPVDALKDSIKYMMSAVGQTWAALEHVTAAYRAMRLNAFQVLSKDSRRLLGGLLAGAIMSPSLAAVQLEIKPVRIVHPIKGHFLSSQAYQKKVHVSATDTARWLNGRFVTLCAANQEAVDVFHVVPVAKDGDEAFDLFVFDQCKLVNGGGLQKHVFEKRVAFCEGVVKSYTAATDRQARYLLGIVDPIKSMSSHCRKFIDEGGQPVFGVGRAEVDSYFGIVADHPALMRHIFVNSIETTAHHLSLLLDRSGETKALKIAKQILAKRPKKAGYVNLEALLTAVPEAKQLKDDVDSRACLLFD